MHSKKAITILFLLSFILINCTPSKKGEDKASHTKIAISSDNNEELIQTEKDYLLTESGVDIFLLGKQIPLNTTNYIVKKEVEIMEEAIEEPIYNIYKDDKKGLSIKPKYDYDSGQFTDKIGEIAILSSDFKTADGIGVDSSIEDFITAYPDFTVWYTYISDAYIIDTNRYSKLQFILDSKGFVAKEPSIEGDMTILKISDFKKNSKIRTIRIY